MKHLAACLEGQRQRYGLLGEMVEPNRRGFAYQPPMVAEAFAWIHLACDGPYLGLAYACIFEHPLLLSLHAGRVTPWERCVINGQFVDGTACWTSRLSKLVESARV